MTKIVGATALGLAILPAIVAAVRQNPSQQPPTFRTSTEIVLIDTQVVAKDGTPIQGLKADQFEVFIDGRPNHLRTLADERSGQNPRKPGTDASSCSRSIRRAFRLRRVPPRERPRHAWSIASPRRTIWD